MLFEVKTEHLSKLTPSEAVDLLRYMLWADADASNMANANIDVPSAINVKDGGIDGKVTGSDRDSVYGIIKKGNTEYQVKSGRFTPNNNSIREILFNKNHKELKNRVRSCLDAGGTLIVFLTGWDGPDAEEEETKRKFLKCLKTVDPKYGDASIEIWRQNRIVGFLRHFPTIRLRILKINGIQSPNGPFYLHEDWSTLRDMGGWISLGKPQQKFIDMVRKNLRNNDGRPIHIRVHGPPGIGKTRLVLEATDTDRIRSQVIYVDDPSVLRQDGFMGHVGRADNGSHVILVVDECDFNNQVDIWNRLESASSRIKLVTIFNESKQTRGTTLTVEVPPLDDEQVRCILQGYVGDNPNMFKWVNACRPSPRAAHIMGTNLKENPEDLFRSPDTVPVWDRFIADRLSLDSQEFKTRRTVLMWLSLFRKFGFSGSHAGEASRIARIVKRKEGISPGVFMDAIDALRRTKILQGRTTLYITPDLLHRYMWSRWWKERGLSMLPPASDLIPEGSKNTGNDNLQEWLVSMFAYGRDSPEVREVAKQMLGDNGLFKTENNLKDYFGSRLFLHLSMAAPQAALAFLQKIIMSKTRDDLLLLTNGRHEVVMALEDMAERKETFIGASRLLLRLAEAENEVYSNNATGVFQNLFRLGASPVSQNILIDMLKDTIESESVQRRIIGMETCNQILMGMGRTVTIDPNDIKPASDLYRPKTTDGEAGYVRNVIGIVAGQIEPENELKTEATKAILDNAGHLLRTPEMTDDVIGALERVYEIGDNYTKLLECIQLILNIDAGLTSETRDRLQGVLNRVVGTGFSSRMRRYVGIPLYVDHGDKDAQDVRQNEVCNLASEAIGNPAKLETELEWLVTRDAKHGYAFGYELAARDPQRNLLPSILKALGRAESLGNALFVGGYLQRVGEDDADALDNELEKMYGDAALCPILPDITRMSGITDASLRRIMRGVVEKKLDYNTLYVTSYVGRDVTEGTLTECIGLLLSMDEDGARQVALNILYDCFVKQNRTLPRELTSRTLLHKSMTCKPDRDILSTITTPEIAIWQWGDVVRALVRQYPDDWAHVAKWSINEFGESDYLGRPGNAATEVIEEIVKAHPQEAWGLISSRIGPPMDRRARRIQFWLRGNPFDRKDGVISAIPVSGIAKWVDKDIEARAAHVSKFLPYDWCMIRQFVARYGDRKDVQNSLIMNLDNEGWMGSETEHHQKKRKDIKKWRSGETNPKVLAWLDCYQAHVDKMIAHAEESEEREF